MAKIADGAPRVATLTDFFPTVTDLIRAALDPLPIICRECSKPLLGGQWITGSGYSIIHAACEGEQP